MPRFAYDHRVPGVFAQDDIRWSDWLTVSASARLDLHHTYGTFFSPRLSALIHRHGWTSRVSAGTGFFASTPLTEETEAAGLSGLRQDEFQKFQSFQGQRSAAVPTVPVLARTFGTAAERRLWN